MYMIWGVCNKCNCWVDRKSDIRDATQFIHNTCTVMPGGMHTFPSHNNNFNCYTNYGIAVSHWGYRLGSNWVPTTSLHNSVMSGETLWACMCIFPTYASHNSWPTLWSYMVWSSLSWASLASYPGLRGLGTRLELARVSILGLRWNITYSSVPLSPKNEPIIKTRCNLFNL